MFIPINSEPTLLLGGTGRGGVGVGVLSVSGRLTVTPCPRSSSSPTGRRRESDQSSSVTRPVLPSKQGGFSSLVVCVFVCV